MRLTATLDIRLFAVRGAELHRKDDFGRYPVAGRARDRKCHLNLTFALSGIPTGEYGVEMALRDAVVRERNTDQARTDRSDI